MNIVKKVLSTLGGVLLAALLIAALAPKATHGLVAALVQVVNTVPVQNATGASGAIPLEQFDAENPARTPWQASCSAFGNGFCTFDVPAGRRLVIEFVSTQTGVPTGPANNGAFVITTTAGGTTVGFNIAPGQHVRTQYGDDVYVASATLRLYADPGTIVYAQNPGADPIAEQYFLLSGYTVCAAETTSC